VLLEGFLSEADPRIDPANIADARQKFANFELARGNVKHAGELLAQSEAYWASVPTQYAEERLEGLGLRARERRASGDLDGAITTMRDAIAQRVALSGREHRETAVLYNSYAIILTADHRLEEALAAYRETLAIYQAIGLGEELDAQIVSGNMGGLEVRLGQLVDAEITLRNAIQRERVLAGNSAAVSAHLGYYGRLYSQTDRPEQALATLHEAVEVAIQYTTPSSPVTVQNELALGEAQLLAGDRGAARVTLEETYKVALAHYGAKHPLTLRIQLAQARVLLATGHTSEAQALLTAIIPGLRDNGAQTVEELGQAMDLVHPTQLTK
jgi:non-specific serine/threonine protein kinase/serine/threonine-protein kinase